MSHISTQKKCGFTFIEMVVVIGVIGFALPALFAIIFSIARAQTKVQHLTEVKKQADSAIDAIKTTIREDVDGIFKNDVNIPGSKIPIVCGNFSTNDGRDLYFHTSDGEYVQFYAASGQLVKNIEGVGEQPLTSDKVKVFIYRDPADPTTILPEIELSCNQEAISSTPLVKIHFWAAYQGSTASTRPEDNAQLEYTIQAKIRNDGP